MLRPQRMPMSMNFSMFTPTVTYFRIIEMPQQEETKTSVPADKFTKL